MERSERGGRLTVTAGSEIWVARLVEGTAQIREDNGDMVLSMELSDLGAPGGARTAVLRVPWIHWLSAIDKGLRQCWEQRG